MFSDQKSHGVLVWAEHIAGWASRGQHPTSLERDMELPLVVTLSLHWALSLCSHICMHIMEIISVFNHILACMEMQILFTFYADQRKIFLCPYWLDNSAWSQQTKIFKTLHLLFGEKKCLILITWRYFFKYLKIYWTGASIIVFHWESVDDEFWKMETDPLPWIWKACTFVVCCALKKKVKLAIF